jgi:hypothetical protein
MIRKIKRIPKKIYNDLCNILKVIIYNSFSKKLVQFSIVDNDAYNFANNNNTTISKVDTIDLEKFYTGNEDIMNFSIFCMLAFKNFIKNSESIISRENLIIFYKLNYRSYALFIFIIKYFLIFYYRYVQIVFIKEYYCSNKEVQNPESNYWIGDDGKKYIVKEYIYTKYIRILYALIFGIIFSFLYGLYFLITLKKTNWRKSFVIGLQIVEYIILIFLFGFSFFNKFNNNDKHILIQQNYYDYIYIILEIIVNLVK